MEQPSGVHPGVGNINANPQFVDAASGNLRLRLGLHCIDSGNNTAVPAGVTTDLEGRPRFVDMPMIPDTGNGTLPIVDMGAYEAFLYADMALGKTATPASVAPGEALTFTLTLANQGSAAATQVVVTDTLAGLTNVTFTSDLFISDTGYTPAYVWTVQDLQSGQSGVITISGVLQSPLTAGARLNTATIAAADDADPNNNTATASFVVLNVAPVITSVPVTTAMQMLPYSYAVAASDANGDALIFTALTLPDWLALTDHGNGTATLAGTPGELHLGEHPVVLRVADGSGAYVEQAFTITV